MIDVFDKIESNAFAAKFGIASGLKMFLGMMHDDIIFKTLCLRIRSNYEAIIDRIIDLAHSEFDYKYENPYDVALSAYIIALHMINTQAGVRGSQLINDVKQTWWAKQVATHLLGLGSP
jgi:hypothetical protein